MPARMASSMTSAVGSATRTTVICGCIASSMLATDMALCRLTWGPRTTMSGSWSSVTNLRMSKSGLSTAAEAIGTRRFPGN